MLLNSRHDFLENRQRFSKPILSRAILRFVDTLQRNRPLVIIAFQCGDDVGVIGCHLPAVHRAEIKPCRRDVHNPVLEMHVRDVLADNLVGIRIGHLGQ